jgi:hypothetical protein
MTLRTRHSSPFRHLIFSTFPSRCHSEPFPTFTDDTHTHIMHALFPFSVHGTGSSPYVLQVVMMHNTQQTRSVRRKESLITHTELSGFQHTMQRIHQLTFETKRSGRDLPRTHGYFGSLRLVHAAPRHEQPQIYTRKLFKRLPVFPRRRVRPGDQAGVDT